MPFGMWVVVGWMVLVAATGLAMIAWGLHTHQFDDIEAAKYPMLEDKEPQGWPGRDAKGRDAKKGGPEHA